MINHCVLRLENFIVKPAGTYSILQLQYSLVIKSTQKLTEDSLYLQHLKTYLFRERKATVLNTRHVGNTTSYTFYNEISNMLRTK